MKSIPSLPLSTAAIAAHCTADARAIALEVVDCTGSTNSDLLARLAQLTQPVLRVAEAQSAGRGRAGRSWQSTPGAGLTASLAWKFAAPLQALSGLPLAVGVLLAEALAQFDCAIQLKWPNDLLLAGRKLGGVLIETASAADGSGTWAVIGIGINTRAPTTPAPDASCASVALDRNRLLAAWLNLIAPAFRQFERQGFTPLAPRWNALHAHAGVEVAIVDREQTIAHGVALGVDASGRLRLQQGQRELIIASGDVSLRDREASHAAAD